jgi:hypothetical protein
MRNPPDRPEGTDENILEQTLKKYIFNTWRGFKWGKKL